MDPNLLVPLVVIVWSVVSLVQLARAGARHTSGTTALLVGQVVLAGAALLLVRDHAAVLSGTSYALLIAVPLIALNVCSRATAAQYFGVAAFAARVASLLHPLDGWTAAPDWVRAERALTHGRTDEAERARRAVRARGPSIFADRLALRFAIFHDDWSEFAEMGDSEEGRARIEASPLVMAAHLSALGRAERYDALIATYVELGVPLVARFPPTAGANVELALAATLGAIDVVERLLDGPLSDTSRIDRESVLARTLQAAGRHDEAARRIERLVSTTGADGGRALPHDVRRQLARVVERPRPTAPPPSPAARRVLDELERETAHSARFALVVRGGRRPVAVPAIALLLVIVFALEVLRGGSTNPRTLVEMGALVLPEELGPGGWWRPYTAALLHWGPVHMTFNLLGLWVLGGILERAWGPGRVVLCYVTAIVVSSHAVIWFGPTLESGLGRSIFAGASGGIMGLYGALLGRLVVGGLAGRGALVRRQLTLLGSLLVAQMVFDATVPGVSATAHLAGLATGAVLGAVLTALGPRAATPAPASG